MRESEYAAAKSEIESFFWTELADNYLEMAKMRLYDETHPARQAACYALHHTLLATLKMLALFLPHVTEKIYLELYAELERKPSIHVSAWPAPDERLCDRSWEEAGEALVAIATAVRRYKSENSLPLSTELAHLRVAAREPALCAQLQAATADLTSISRAQQIEICDNGLDAETGNRIQIRNGLEIAIAR
jgi:valyl-tRNA synthetase